MMLLLFLQQDVDLLFRCWKRNRSRVFNNTFQQNYNQSAIPLDSSPDCQGSKDTKETSDVFIFRLFLVGIV